MLNRTALLLTLALVLGAACRRSTPSANTPSTATAERAAPTRDPERADAPVADAAVASPASAFHTVVTYDDWLDLFPLGGDTMMIAAGPRLVRVDGDGVLHDDPALAVGIELPWSDFFDVSDEDRNAYLGDAEGWWTLQVGGTWPSATFLTLATPGLPRAPDVYRWAGDRWRAVKARGDRHVAYPRAVRPYSQGSWISWRGLFARALFLDDKCSDCPDEVYETPEYRAAERAVKAAKLLAVLAGPAKAPAVRGQDVVAFDALESGEVFLASRDGSLSVIAPGASPRKTKPAHAEILGIVARGPTEVAVFGGIEGRPFLAELDGEALVAVDFPDCGAPIASLSIHGASWWASCGEPAPRSYEALNSPGDLPSSLWRREGSGAWMPIALAPGLAPRFVHVRGADDVWVGAIGRGNAVILHSREPQGVLVLGSTLENLKRFDTARPKR